jgi:hypothetical protein
VTCLGLPQKTRTRVSELALRKTEGKEKEVSAIELLKNYDQLGCWMLGSDRCCCGMVLVEGEEEAREEERGSKRELRLAFHRRNS